MIGSKKKTNSKQHKIIISFSSFAAPSCFSRARMLNAVTYSESASIHKKTPRPTHTCVDQMFIQPMLSNESISSGTENQVVSRSWTAFWQSSSAAPCTMHTKHPNGLKKIVVLSSSSSFQIVSLQLHQLDRFLEPLFGAVGG